MRSWSCATVQMLFAGMLLFCNHSSHCTSLRKSHCKPSQSQSHSTHFSHPFGDHPHENIQALTNLVNRKSTGSNSSISCISCIGWFKHQLHQPVQLQSCGMLVLRPREVIVAAMRCFLSNPRRRPTSRRSQGSKGRRVDGIAESKGTMSSRRVEGSNMLARPRFPSHPRRRSAGSRLTLARQLQTEGMKRMAAARHRGNKGELQAEVQRLTTNLQAIKDSYLSAAQR